MFKLFIITITFISYRGAGICAPSDKYSRFIYSVILAIIVLVPRLVYITFFEGLCSWQVWKILCIKKLLLYVSHLWQRQIFADLLRILNHFSGSSLQWVRKILTKTLLSSVVYFCYLSNRIQELFQPGNKWCRSYIPPADLFYVGDMNIVVASDFHLGPLIGTDRLVFWTRMIKMTRILILFCFVIIIFDYSLNRSTLRK